MKTPREILLARHQLADPELDRVRQRVIDDLDAPQQQPRSLFCLVTSWLGLVRLPRVVWGGLGAAWLVILGLNLASWEPATPGDIASVESVRSPETLQALREQRRLFAELVGSLNPSEADLPPIVPRPRSEGRTRFHTA